MLSLANVSAVCSIIGLALALLLIPALKQALRQTLRALLAPALGVRMKRAGIADFYPSRHALNRRRNSKLYETLKNAKREIGIVGISLQRTIVHQELADDLVDLLKKNTQLTVRVSLVDPKSVMIPHLAQSSHRTREDLQQAIAASLRAIRSAQARINVAGQQERLIVRTCEFHLFSTLVAIDVPPEGDNRHRGAFFIVEHSLYGIPIDDRYSMEVRRAGSDMFEKLTESYQAIIALEDMQTDDIMGAPK